MENIINVALEPFQEMFQRFERHILLAHFHPMQRRGRNAKFAGEGGQAQLSAPVSQKPAKPCLH
jgi:hypothetical protein